MTLSYLLFSFIIYSIVGWLIESIYKSIIEKKLINSGFLYGPWCPIYGFGAILILLSFLKIKNPVWLFLLGFVILSLWEYCVSIFLEKIFHTKYWDYSKEKINLNGRICLKNSIYWGILTVIFILFINPNVTKLIYKIPHQILIYINISLYLILSIDTIMSCLKIHSINRSIEKLKQINKDFKYKLAKVKHEAKSKLVDSKNVVHNAELELLIKEHNKISLKIYKRLARLIKAFPTIKSDKINKFLNNKIEIEDLKEKINEIKDKIKKSRNK